VSRTRTLLVAGNDAFLDGLVNWMAQDGQFEVVGTVNSGSQALERIDALKPDVVLMDVSLPDASGFVVSQRIKARPDAPLVVLLSFYDNRAARLEAWAAGADGFVAKSEMTGSLTPLLGDLLRRRGSGVRNQGSVTPSMPVPPKEGSE
jgi:DNA-binding NarL/FixJ family response regulator